MNLEQVTKIMETVDPTDATVVTVCVPTRAIRVLKLKGDLTFRVEQLDPQVWKWRSISTHVGDAPWEAFHVALEDAWKHQARLKEKIKLAQHEHRMARLKAENPVPQS
jgi:hypothetical protein